MDEQDIALLISVNSVTLADMIEAMLKSNDIPVLKKYRGIGLHMQTLFGITASGVDIEMYVPSAALERAKELIEVLL